MKKASAVIALLLMFSTTAYAKRRTQHPAVNEVAPEIATTNQQWANSEPRSLAGLKGHVVVLDFWSTTCHPCMDGLPRMEKLYQRYKDRGVIVIGITYQPMIDEVFGAAREKGVTYPLLGSNDDFNYEVSHRYQIDGIPAAVVIDKNGIVRWRAGGDAIERGIDSAVQGALRQ